MCDLWRAVYTSIGAVAFDQAGLDDLNAACAASNRRRAVTGILLFDGTSFIQALEGPQAGVHAAMARIRADPRHRDVIVFADGPIAAREFGGWNMRSFGLPPAWRDLRSGYLAVLAEVTDARLRAILTMFGMLSLLRAASGATGTPSIEERSMSLHLDLLIQQAQESIDRGVMLRRLADDAAHFDRYTKRSLNLPI